MKRLIYFLVCLVALSCTKTMSFVPEPVQDELMLNAQIDASQRRHNVYVGLSRTTNICGLDDALVSCYVNGDKIADATLEEDEQSKYQCRYSFDADLRPGDLLRISAEWNGRIAFAEVTVPETTAIISSMETFRTFTGPGFKVAVSSLPHNTSYLRLGISCITSLHFSTPAGEWSDNVYEQFSEPALTHSGDPYLSNRLGGEIGDDFFGYGGSENHFCVFSDESFEDGKASVTVYSHDPYYDWSEPSSDSVLVSRKWILKLYTMNWPEYKYLQAQNVLHDNGYNMSDMLDPVILPTNVIGGIGFVGIQFPTEYSIDVPDEIHRLFRIDQ